MAVFLSFGLAVSSYARRSFLLTLSLATLLLVLFKIPTKRQRTSNGNAIETDEDGNINGYHFAAAPDANDDPDRVKFAYWVPNVSGGLVISKIPQITKYDIPYLLRTSAS